ncbi:hypothetical protein N1851_014505 [Merluccius polli]|uniref:Uncharacterized protein n=1 Tax=Merluccius polli TaxID=89951 RepID=A0AA47MT67_MERPO|nr:hypothetical protein N1851_014505 [Merluccius polli]
MGNPDCVERMKGWMGSRWVKVGSLLVGLGKTPLVGLLGLGETPPVGLLGLGETPHVGLLGLGETPRVGRPLIGRGPGLKPSCKVRLAFNAAARAIAAAFSALAFFNSDREYPLYANYPRAIALP